MKITEIYVRQLNGEYAFLDPATTTERTLPSSSISSVGVAKEGMVNNFTSLESSNLDDSEINTRVENPETTPVEESIGH